MQHTQLHLQIAHCLLEEAVDFGDFPQEQLTEAQVAHGITENIRVVAPLLHLEVLFRLRGFQLKIHEGG